MTIAHTPRELTPEHIAEWLRGQLIAQHIEGPGLVRRTTRQAAEIKNLDRRPKLVTHIARKIAGERRRALLAGRRSLRHARKPYRG